MYTHCLRPFAELPCPVVTGTRFRNVRDGKTRGMFVTRVCNKEKYQFTHFYSSDNNGSPLILFVWRFPDVWAHQPYINEYKIEWLGKSEYKPVRKCMEDSTPPPTLDTGAPPFWGMEANSPWMRDACIYSYPCFVVTEVIKLYAVNVTMGLTMRETYVITLWSMYENLIWTKLTLIWCKWQNHGCTCNMTK